MRDLIVEDVNNKNFKNLGEIIKIPLDGEKEPTLKSSFFNHYAGLGFIDCSDIVEFGITTFNKRKLEVDKLEQHAKTPELLFAIDGAFVMPVAPIIYQKGEAFPDLNQIKAIKVCQGEGVIFKDGIWHWAPFPYNKEKSSVLVGFKKDTCEDDIIIRDLDKKY
jgi:ureidoglycolate hydrolase